MMSSSSSLLFVYMLVVLLALLWSSSNAFQPLHAPHLSLKVHTTTSSSGAQMMQASSHKVAHMQRKSSLKMNFVQDAFRFLTNLKKEASAKHILKTGSNANEQLSVLKKELEGLSGDDLSNAFSEIAAKVSECPSAKRGGNLGTFKPGMMVKEFDQVVFEKDVGVVHGPVQTQFGSHLILITRRYEGEKK